MSDLYTVIPGLQPTSQELLEAELFAKQVLEAQYPELELREGTGLRDLVLRPTGMLMALVKKASDFLFSQNSLSGVDDTTPTDLVDGILSNWFLTRQIGTQSVINARLYFARQKNTAISSSVYFSPDNVLKFFPASSVSYASSSMVFDSYTNEYYIDMDLVAESQGSTYNIASGSLLYFSNFDPYFLHAEINFLKSESIESETNLKFIDRAKTSISTRNLINNPSIDYNLRAEFNYITRLSSVGMGDPEMVRDQIKAIFDDKIPTLVTAVSGDSFIATVTLANHGYNDGQRVVMAGASPTLYNGEFIITVIDTSTFSYPITDAGQLVTVLPTVVEKNLPTLLHNGGMVDVYCSEKLAAATIQVTLDEFGKGQITGPVYSFQRSDTSGGTSDDTVPTTNTSTISSINVVGTIATATTSVPHVFRLTDTITVSGAIQLQTLTSLTCSGTLVTATKAGHGYLAGNSVTISGASLSGYNGTFVISSVTTNTFMYIVTSTLVSPAVGTITASVELLNGPRVLTGVTSTTFSYEIAQTSTVAATGTMSATALVPFTSSNPYVQDKALSSITSTGGVTTVSLSHHGYTVGRIVTISGSSISGYNGSWRITTIPNPDQFTFNTPVGVSGTSSTGVATFVIPWYDYGFSDRQIINLDFGLVNANLTASFDINYFQNITSIQTYLESSANRVMSADLLARGLNFYLLDVSVVSYNSSIPDSALVSSVITSYLAGLATGEMFIMSDMMAKLRLNGVMNIQNPVLVTFKHYTKDLAPVGTGTITDVLDPDDVTNVFLLNSVTTSTQTLDPDNVIIL